MKTKDLEIVSYSKKGHGVAYLESKKKVEVIGAFKKEKVHAELKKRGKKGRVISVLEKSSDRISPKCKHTHLCGGCTWQELKYEVQLKEKMHTLQNLFANFPLDPIIPCENPFYYRNKMEFSFSENAAGTKYLGLMIAGAGSYVFNVEECHLASFWVSEVLCKVRNWWEQSNVKAYNPHKNEGVLRYITFREGMNTKEKMVTLTLSGSLDEIQSFKKAVGENIQVFLRYQHAKKGSPTYFETVSLSEKDHITETLHVLDQTLHFKISPDSFFQPNTRQAEILYTKALEGLKDQDLVFDLYSGTGTLGMIASKKAKRVIGIELNENAVKDARENAKLNAIENFTIYPGDVGQVITKLMAEKDFETPQAMILDPPRAGLDTLALHLIKKLLPKKLIYISCNPYTQVENIASLKESGYVLKKVQPVDQFPHTYHIENIAFLER